jgi:dienelactone hydrolase
MSCPQCFTGHKNPGSPTGRVEKVHGRPTYIAEPPKGTPLKGIIIIIPDAFGWEFVNNKILADHYASAADYLVYLPDFQDGEHCRPSYPLVVTDIFEAMRRQNG